MKSRISSLVTALIILLAMLQPAYAQAPTSGTVNKTANVRNGPGTTYNIVGSLEAGSPVRITSCNDDCTWYELGPNVWIAAFLVTTDTSTPQPTRILSAAPTENPITIVSWNVESGGALQAAVSDRMGSFQDVYVWGLAEVNAIDAEAFEFGAEEGEGADYQSYLGTTGGADRLLLIWDEDRFDLMASGEIPEIGLGARAPIWVALRETATNLDFIVMVNHLHRSNDNTRHRQAEMLNAWAASQVMPIIAIGDYNFDWNLPVGETDHDIGYDNMTKDGVWTWIRPAELVTTQCSGWPCSYTSVLDFVFAAGPARQWNISSQIIVADGDFPDDNTTPDHRPLMAVILPASSQVAPVATSAPTTMPTAVPTRIPTIAPTATVFSTEEQAYIDFLTNLTDAYSQSLQVISEQFLAAGQTPTLLNDQTWILRTATAVAVIQVENQKIREQTAPPRFAAVHAEMLSAASAYDQAMDLIIQGVDTLDGSKFIDAQTNMLEGSDAINRANAAWQLAISTSGTSASATSAPTCPQANSDANLRSGPGTGYGTVGSVQSGECLTITGRTEIGDWFQLSSGNWIAAFLVDNAGLMASIPVTVVATPTQLPTATQMSPVVDPAPTLTPTPQPTTPSCDPNYTGACIPVVGYDLDCGDVPFKRFQSVGSDPHKFDRDHDGIACES